MQTDQKTRLSQQLDRFSMISMHLNMNRNMQFIQEHDLSFIQLNSLMFIHRSGCSNIQNLVDYIGVTKAAVSQMVDRLVDSGLVSRNEDPIDRRSKLICLSKAGDELLQKVFITNRKWTSILAENLTETQQQQACQIFEIFNDKLVQLKEGINLEVKRNYPC